MEVINGPEHDETIEKERQEWARQMRLRFTPKEMLHEDGAIDFEYMISSTFNRRRGSSAYVYATDTSSPRM
jgi:ribosome-binding factor A